MSTPDPNATPPTVEAPVNVVAPDALSPDPALTPVDSSGTPLADAAVPPLADPQPVDAAGAPIPAPSDFPTFKAATPAVQPVDPNAPTTPDVVPADAPVLADQATAPTTGEPLKSETGAAILPLPDSVTTPDVVNPADSQPSVPTITAHVDPAGAAALVLDKQASAPVEPPPPTRSEVAAQAVIDAGTLTPPSAGGAIHPVETLDGHTVDASGTADDSQPGLVAADAQNNATPISELETRAIDQRIALADRNKGVAANLPTDLLESLVVSVAKVLAESGAHRDLIHQWVDQAYADLQGQRNSAQAAGNDDPYPLLTF